MTSNGDAVLNSSSNPLGARDDSLRGTLASSPEPPKTTSPPSTRDRRPSAHRLHNGDTRSDDGQNESEAETVVLGDAREGLEKDKELIKIERDDDDDDDDDDTSQLPSAGAVSPTRSPATNGRRNSTRDAKDALMNGAKRTSERDVKSPAPTSPSSRTTSRNPKESSPASSAKSPVNTTASLPQPATRGRSSSATESRKRKLRDGSSPKPLEPPRQKAKTEGLKDSRTQPTSPATPGVGPGRPHKRSQSTQSVVQGAAARKRRDLASLALAVERKNWSDSSSDNSSSPRPVQTPSLLSQTRVKRSSHRALTSPARAMPHKRNVDKFGATRLARESEKGDLPAVKAAYHAAPEELDQVDFAGIAPLQKASLHGWAAVVEFLIKKGCRTDCESDDRDTPLIDAVENGHLDVVKLLLDRGHVNPHHQNKKGQRALDVLDPDEEDAEEIENQLVAAMRRTTDTVPHANRSQPETGERDTTSRLLYNEYNTETLVEKAGDGDMAAVGELLNSNIKPNIACGVAASRGGHYDILSILLASGLKSDPDPSKHSETPMLVAIGRGHLKIVSLLLEQDTFNPTRRNREGKTYFEISEDRQGPKWEQERDVLKEAYDNHLRLHKSPKRSKKEALTTSTIRTKRRSSPIRREQSSSPRLEPKRAPPTKPTNVPQGSQKARRLVSGKEMANREVKRRRRVVSEETSNEESDDDVRPPTKKAMAKPRSFSEGEEHKPAKKSVKTRPGEYGATKRSVRARSGESGDEVHQRQRLGPKIRTKTEKILQEKPTPTPDAESPDERKSVKKNAKPRALNDKVRRRRASDASVDGKMKKTSTPSTKSTPAPPDKASTPESVRERRRELDRQAAEPKRKAAEAEERRREEEEAARKAAAEEEARRKAEAEAKAEAKAKAEAEAEARRLAEEAEAARRREEEEEEARRRAEEEARRQEKLASRRNRISKLPRALRRACEMGIDRPLHFSGEELGISAIFLPLYYATSKELQPEEHQNAVSKSYIMSFQAVGILGLPELDLAHLDSPYSTWARLPVTRKQRELLLRQYDVALLAQDFRFPMEGTPEFDYNRIQESIKEARQQFLEMDGLYWIEDTLLYPEVEKVESLQPLAEEIRNLNKRRQVNVAEPEVEAAPEKKHRPRKSFMDVVLGQNTVDGTVECVKTNGNG